MAENSELLKKKLVSVETEVKTLLRKMRFFLGKDMDVIEDYYNKSTKERDALNVTLKKTADQLQLGVRKFQEQLKNKSFLCENAEDLKVLIKGLAFDICLRREQLQNGYKSLNYEFHELDENILEWESRFHAWGSPKDIQVRQVPVLYVQNGNGDHNLPPEVVAFQEFVYQSGGHTGGWDGCDHQKFLQLKQKYKDEDTFLKQAITELIGLTEQQILDHKTWFQEYLIKKKGKEIAIQEWKKKKEEKRNTAFNEVDVKPEMTVAQKNKQRELFEERQKKLEKIKEWKAYKEAERVLKEQELEEEKKLEQKKRSIDQEKRAIIKQKLEEHRKQQEDLERQKWEKELKERRKIEEILTNKDKEKIVEFQKKDQQWLLRKEEKQKRKEQEDMLRDKRLARLKKEVSVTAVRDPTRLLEPTEIWKIRRQSSNESKEIFSQVKISHRAIPEWRKGLHIL